MDYIKKCTCDGCGTRGLTVFIHDSHGTEVLALCRRCAPGSFDAVARLDIDAWVAGTATGHIR